MNTLRVACLAMVMMLAGATLSACRPASRVEPAPSGSTAGAAQLLREACNWLWQRQTDDGSWRSEQYAVLRSGQSYTPFVLFTLLAVPEDVCPRPPGGVERALEFIRRQTRADGVLGMADPDLPEYPNYATSYALRCLVQVGRPDDAELIGRMRTALLAEQYRIDSGFGADSPAYGGWGFGGVRPPGEPGHMDLAHTRRVLQALRDTGLRNETVFQQAQSFLRLVQRHPDEPRPQPSGEVPGGNHSANVSYDGGFYFSPVVLDANKGRLETGNAGYEPYYRSYATATCDGLLALLAAGAAVDDERVQAARHWLQRHDDLAYPQGIPTDHPDPWGHALHYYHLAVRAEANSALDEPGQWRRATVKLLTDGRREDGSYANDLSPLMKEDDPVLCTALAATALVRCLDK